MHNLLKCVLCIEMCTFLPSPGLEVGSAAENQMGIMITIQQNKWLYIVYTYVMVMEMEIHLLYPEL